MSGTEGFLAIWSDVGRDVETDYLHWLTREHTQERLRVPGFAGVRVFRARATDFSRFFILYALSGPEVVDSAAYLARLNDPTPWSCRIMPLLRNFARGGGSRLVRAGHGAGTVIAPVVIEPAALDEALRLAPELSGMDRIAAVQVLAVDRAASEVTTNEKTMRVGDGSFSALLVIEALDDPALLAALGRVQATAGGRERSLVYDQIFSLDGASQP